MVTKRYDSVPRKLTSDGCNLFKDRNKDECFSAFSEEASIGIEGFEIYGEE